MIHRRQSLHRKAYSPNIDFYRQNEVRCVCERERKEVRVCVCFCVPCLCCVCVISCFLNYCVRQSVCIIRGIFAHHRQQPGLAPQEEGGTAIHLWNFSVFVFSPPRGEDETCFTMNLVFHYVQQVRAALWVREAHLVEGRLH